MPSDWTLSVSGTHKETEVLKFDHAAIDTKWNEMDVRFRFLTRIANWDRLVFTMVDGAGLQVQHKKKSNNYGG